MPPSAWPVDLIQLVTIIAEPLLFANGPSFPWRAPPVGNLSSSHYY